MKIDGRSRANYRLEFLSLPSPAEEGNPPMQGRLRTQRSTVEPFRKNVDESPNSKSVGAQPFRDNE